MLTFATPLSIALALALGLLIGPLLGRLATQWFSGRGLSNLLIEVRGAFLPFLLAPILAEATHWKSWVVVGIVVGFMQGISIARWIARRTGEWSPSLMAAIALGRSRASILSSRAMARGAVIGTLATTTLQVVLLEAILSALNLPEIVPHGSVGRSLQSGTDSSFFIVLALGSLAILTTEAVSSFFLQRRVNRS